MRYYSSTASEKTLSSAVSNVDSEIALDSTTGLPVSYPFTLVLDPETATEEIVLVTGPAAGVGKTYAIVRGTGTSNGVEGGDGTSKWDHASGAKAKHMITARDLQEPQNHMAASTNVHGIANTANLLTTSSTIGTSQLASNAVTTVKITDLNVTTAKIADSAVTSAKIADGTIVDADINASAAIAWTKIAPSSTVSATELGYLDGVTSAIQTQLDAKQSLDADLTAVAGLSSSGFIARTGSGTAAARTLTAGEGITVTNGDGVSGDTTIANSKVIRSGTKSLSITAGSGSVSIGSADGYTGFTSAPVVTASVVDSNGRYFAYLNNNPSSTAASIGVRHYDSTSVTVTLTVHWIAIGS